jgi:hypothetical protein
MAAEYTFRPVQKSDARDVFSLLVSAGLAGEEERQEWERLAEWAFWANPYRGELPAGWVAVDDQGLLAYKNATVVPYRTRLHSGVGASVGHLCVRAGAHPAIASVFTRKHLRNGGIPVQFGAHFNEASGRIWQPMVTSVGNLSNVTYTAAASYKTLWQQRIRRVGGPVLAKFPGVGLIAWVHANVNRLSFPKGIDKASVVHVNTFQELKPEELNTLCRDAEADLDFTLCRDAQFLAWRYEDHPRHRDFRKISLIDDGGSLRGVGVLDIAGETANINECIVRPGDLAAQVSLIKALTDLATKEERPFISSKSITRPVSLCLERSGFTSVEKTYDQYLLWEEGGQKPAKAGDTLLTYDEFRFS